MKLQTPVMYNHVEYHNVSVSKPMGKVYSTDITVLVLVKGSSDDDVGRN